MFIPLTVGRWRARWKTCASLLTAGAGQVSINTSAVTNLSWGANAPTSLVRGDCRGGGRWAVSRTNDRWEAFHHGGATPPGWMRWPGRKKCNVGRRRNLLTSTDRDGTKIGFNLPLTRASAHVRCRFRVIALGGVGTWQHLADGGPGKAHADAGATLHLLLLCAAAHRRAGQAAWMREQGMPQVSRRALVPVSGIAVTRDDKGLVTATVQDKSVPASAPLMRGQRQLRIAATDRRQPALPTHWSRLAQPEPRQRAKNPATCNQCTGSAWIAMADAVLLVGPTRMAGLHRHTGRESCFFIASSSTATGRRRTRCEKTRPASTPSRTGTIAPDTKRAARHAIEHAAPARWRATVLFTRRETETAMIFTPKCCSILPTPEARKSADPKSSYRCLNCCTRAKTPR